MIFLKLSFYVKKLICEEFSFSLYIHVRKLKKYMVFQQILCFIFKKVILFIILYCFVDSTVSVRSPQIPSSPRFADTSAPFPSQFDFEGFKTDVQSTLGEPFFRKLKPIEQVSI